MSNNNKHKNTANVLNEKEKRRNTDFPSAVFGRVLAKSWKYPGIFCQLVVTYLPTPPLGQDMTQGQFLSGVLQVWIQSFPSPRLFASPRLKKSVCPTIYP